ncbi:MULTISPECIES: cytochrome P450 [Thermoactinomyces]|uniref:Cytochrome P450 n=1 Tax=Thermoactinomyces daqus TaxID=1329516 RepID=A0A7W2AJQ7_9BACL|nr:MULTISPECIES: cytochrome P450 [Thermoactinomyces]MBA4544665.1 cytochrome P450 [Thermoactinomyces daqus]MBH8598619.1 cytochrome P450 [Thermoactinomyces sp. CICC 10523]MBH8605125.1 cytochrome P450 [Thermoactinomyces sp. CICC 10522]MBH8609059.1 cytochrome P450 [Thermoactinomyces sp. CICC 10521]
MTNNITTGPRGLPISGNLFAFRKDPLGFLQKAAKEHGDVVHIRFGPQRHIYLISNPEYIKEVLVTKQSSFHKAKGLRTAKAVIGEGLLTSEGKKHLRQRRLIQPVFHKQRIAAYGDRMVEFAKNLIDGWQDREERLITQDMMELTLAIITDTMFGIDVRQDVHDIGHAIDVGMHYVSRRASSFIDIPLAVPTKSNREFQHAIEVLDKTIYHIIEERRSQSEPERGDLLSMLLAARDEMNGTGMTDQEVRDQVMTIFIAGHETTANTLSWTWYLLSQHPEVERRFWDELDNVLEGRLPTVDDIPSLTYTNNILWEAMRLYPPAWSISREAVEPVQIGEYCFEPGETLMMSQYVMHRKEEYFENPDRFFPERFEGDILKRIPQFAYFPFGGGPRICIGNNFALMEAVLLLATIGQRYKLELAPNHPSVEPEPLVTLRPKKGIRMVVKQR